MAARAVPEGTGEDSEVAPEDSEEDRVAPAVIAEDPVVPAVLAAVPEDPDPLWAEAGATAVAGGTDRLPAEAAAAA